VQSPAIDRAVARMDFTRRSPVSIGGRVGHKEWHHFCILGETIDLLVNFSLSDDVRAEAEPGRELARITLLVRAEGWDGDVEGFAAEEVVVRGGRVDLRFGRNRLRFVDGVYRITIALTERPVTVDLELRPLTMPGAAPNIPLPESPPLHWVIVPRLRARGRVSVAGRVYELDDVLAYHDHNWGHFLWGHAFAWVWGFALPDDAAIPWSLAFVRLTNRFRTRALAQGLFLWRGTTHHRVFLEDDLVVRMDPGVLRPTRVFKLPLVRALLSRDTATDVPRWVEMRAAGDGDALVYRFEAADLAQVVIPSETGMHVTIINEVTGRASLRGTIRGEPVDFEGRAICEFLGT
jgi:hypothetical protein